MKKPILYVNALFLFGALAAHAQTVLNADGPGNTYELINSVLAPGYNAIEVPDISHSDFGRHITEVFDTDLNKNVFEFFIHVTPDNDISTLKTDRQRIEIKTYGPSPSNLKGTVGETVQYKWRFKIPVGFQPSTSFTHIHQVKAVDGDDGNPIFTLTPRKGTPNKLELIYVKDENSGTDKKVIVNLSLFEGVWVEVTETIKIGASGTYAIAIKKVSDNSIILSYSSADIQTIRADNSFIRPKWGIYRSLATPSSLRDESIRFSDISIQELPALSTKDFDNDKNTGGLYPNPVRDVLNFTDSFLDKLDAYKIFDDNGKAVASQKITSERLDVSFLSSGIYHIQFYEHDKKIKNLKFIKQ